ncbi:MAG: L-fuculokinase [Candidatus Poribacteria bacterium]|nr:MAG: L-fuculokinase [Candidatus Poribacteria bacterium]
MRAQREALVIWDCGATNTTVSLVGTNGRVFATASRPTTAERHEDGLIWPLDRFWENFCDLTRQLLDEHRCAVRAVNITTFGVCWGAISPDDRLVYPVISWKCTRTREQVRWAEQHLDLDLIFLQTGAPPFHFNTAFSLRWIRDHRPEVLKTAETFLMMPQLFVHRLTGERVAERTMATTTMLFDLHRKEWANDLFEAFEVPNKFPQEVGSPGEVVGTVTAQAAEATGIPQGTPVCAGGHDTVVATAGACRDLRSDPLFSTGTWSLLVRTHDQYQVRLEDRRRNMPWQLNPHAEGVLGGYNNQGHMIGGLAFDLVRKLFLPEASAAEATEVAAKVPPGSHGVYINPTFVAGTGPNPEAPSALVGWEDGLPPETAVRAVLESLAYQTRDCLEYMQGEVSSILIGGGFAKNRLFAQILADVTGRRVELAGIPEVTTLGAAVLAMVGAGIVSDVQEAWKAIAMPTETFTPNPQAMEVYEPLYRRHRRLIEALGSGI